MLALTRRTGERIVLGDNIVVTVVEIKGDSVRLAIEAPRDIKIYRGELYDSIAAENREAAAHQTKVALDALHDVMKK